MASERSEATVVYVPYQRLPRRYAPRSDRVKFVVIYCHFGIICLGNDCRNASPAMARESGALETPEGERTDQ